MRIRTGSYLVAVAGLVASTALVAGGVTSCGGSTSVDESAPDASGDATGTTDGTLDSPVESSTADSPLDAPTSSSDAGDGGLPPPDGPEQVDASDGSACGVAVPSADGFLGAVAQAACGTLARCCDLGASFNMPLCLSLFDTPPSILGVGNATPFIDGGRLSYQPAASCGCLEAISNLGCGFISSDGLSALRDACFGALEGTVPIANADGGSACASSFECEPGSFCTVEYPGDLADAALGTCQPLVGDGGACTTDNQCDYLTNGHPASYCGADNTCIPQKDAGELCTKSSACQSNFCSGTCAGGIVFASAATCVTFTLAAPDAGDGG